MNSRERVLRAIRFEHPDRVPIGYFMNHAAKLKYGQPLVDLCRRHPNDFYDTSMITLLERDEANYLPDGSYYKREVDEWGCEWIYYKQGIMGEVKCAPLRDWASLRDYRIPSPPARTAEERRQAREAMDRNKEQYIGWGSAGNLFERMQWVRGVEDLFADIAEDCEEIYILADRLIDENLIPYIERALEDGADVIGLTDDWGTQNQLLINPTAWRNFFKPRYKKMIDLIHQGGALAWLHSDGMILEIVPDLIEIGLDVLNPQLSCHDLPALAEATRGKLCLYGTLDYQYVLPFGTPSDVDAHVREVTEIFARPEGGFMYGAGAQDEDPLENIAAVLDAMDRYCTLPTSLKA
jgi:uroporphyrinogen decarboxylase